ncbi:MAG TPA: DUF1616 domain-containing protein [Chloroflexota bacterium]|jgi:uncharacterized membrane protein|nr:DUF1616 domain-containing protein [Chloroflexota bacterium]
MSAPAQLRRSTVDPIWGRIMLVGLGMFLLNFGRALPPGGIRGSIVLVGALFCPGYAIILALLGPRQKQDPIPVLFLTALVSMAFYSLLVLGVYWANHRIDAANLLPATNVAIGGLLFLALVRGSIAQLPSFPSPGLLGRRLSRAVSRTTSISPRLAGPAAAIAASILGVVVVLAELPQSPFVEYTQFYYVGTWSHLNHVVTFKPGQVIRAQIGITNHTLGTKDYRVSIYIDHIRVKRRFDALVPAKKSWADSIAVRVPADGCLHRVSFDLTLHYRSPVITNLTLWGLSTAHPAIRQCPLEPSSG